MKSGLKGVAIAGALATLMAPAVTFAAKGKAAKGEARKGLKRRIEEELDRFERFQLAD